MAKLEEVYGAMWRPESKQKAWFCRRKIIIDEIRAQVAAGKTAEAAVAALDLQREGGSDQQAQ